jgi:hypothetical protein
VGEAKNSESVGPPGSDSRRVCVGSWLVGQAASAWANSDLPLSRFRRSLIQTYLDGLA